MKFSIQKVKLRFDEQQIGKRIYLCSVISVSILVLVCGLFLHFFFHSVVDKACKNLQEIFSKTSLVRKKRFIRAYSIVPFVKTKNLQNGHRTVFTASTKNSSNEMFFIVKNSYEQQKKDHEIFGIYTDGFLLQSHVRKNLFTYSNFSQILGQFSALLVTEIYEQPVEMSTLKNSLGNKKESPICFFLHAIQMPITFEDFF